MAYYLKLYGITRNVRGFLVYTRKTLFFMSDVNLNCSHLHYLVVSLTTIVAERNFNTSLLSILCINFISIITWTTCFLPIFSVYILKKVWDKEEWSNEPKNAHLVIYAKPQK